MFVLKSNSSRIFGGWSIHASHLDSRLKRRDAHKTCALLCLLLAGEISRGGCFAGYAADDRSTAVAVTSGEQSGEFG